MKRTLHRTLAALTVAAILGTGAALADTILTPADTAWGAPATAGDTAWGSTPADVDVDVTVVNPLDTAWG